jgi:hypothetical protein
MTYKDGLHQYMPSYASVVTLQVLIGTVSLTIMPYNDWNVATLDGSYTNVSGYHGLGAYTSWIVTVFSTTITSLSACLSLDAFTPNAVHRNSHEDNLDGELLTVISYPLIASVDILLRLGSETHSPSLLAALIVTQNGWVAG